MSSGDINELRQLFREEKQTLEEKKALKRKYNREAQRDWRSRNKPANLKEPRPATTNAPYLRQVAAKQAFKDEAIQYLGGKCAHCSGVFHRNVYDFHHIDPTTKTENIGRLLQSRNWETVKPELDKCILLCANCHRMHHVVRK